MLKLFKRNVTVMSCCRPVLCRVVVSTLCFAVLVSSLLTQARCDVHFDGAMMLVCRPVQLSRSGAQAVH